MLPQTLSATLAPTSGIAGRPSSCGLDFWHTPMALQWVCNYIHAEPAMLYVTDDANDAQVQCLLRRLPGGLHLASVYPYGCIEGDVSLWWQAGSAIRAALRQRKVTRLEIPFCGEYASQVSEPIPSAAHAYLARSMAAVRHVLDLPTQSTELESSFHPNIRWAIRKAVRSGYTVRRAQTNEGETIQKLYAATMRAKGAPINYGPERWFGMLQELGASNSAHIFIGEFEGQPAGIAAVVDASCSRHFIQLAVPPEFRAGRLAELLVATVLHDAQARGLRYFDFMASPAADAGLIAFKSKWGTRVEPIQHIVVPGLPLLAPLVDAGRWFNRTRARWHAK